MIEGQIGNPPESYLKTILPLIDVARGLLEKGEQLVPIAFVGNFATSKTAQVLLESGTDAEKDRSALAIRLAADMLEADFVFLIMEAWSLRKDKMPQMDAILDKYGSIGASPVSGGCGFVRAGDALWRLDVAMRDQAQGDFQEEADHRHAGVPVFQGSRGPFYPPPKEESGRRGWGDASLTLRN